MLRSPADLGHVSCPRNCAPAAKVHLYRAGHGFNCDLRASNHAESAALAGKHALASLARHLGAAGGH